MKKLYINSGGFDAVFNDFKDSFGGELTADNNEYNLEINSKWTKGSIKGTRFDDRVLFMHFDLEFNHEVSLSIESFKTAPVFFVYCEKGNVSHSFGANGEKKILNKNQSAVLSNSSVINSVLYFENHKRIQFTLLGIPTIDNKNAELVSQVKHHFTNDSGNYIYIGKENLKISDKIKEYNTVPEKGLVGTQLKKSIIMNIIETEVVRHSSNYPRAFDPVVNLTMKPVSEIKRIFTMNFSVILAAARHFRSKYHFHLNHIIKN